MSVHYFASLDLILFIKCFILFSDIYIIYTEQVASVLCFTDGKENKQMYHFITNETLNFKPIY